MSNPNQIKNEIVGMVKNSERSLKALLDKYNELSRELDNRFRTELRDQNGAIAGLEDFYALNMMVKRNSQNVSNALNMIVKLRNIADYDITEELEEAAAKQIAKDISKV